MSDGSDQAEIYQVLADKVEDIQGAMDELFGEESSEDGLLYLRSNTLHQYNILASTFHHANSIDFIKNSQKIGAIFNEEVQTANYRTSYYRKRAIKKLNQNILELEEFCDALEDIDVEIKYVLKKSSLHLQEFNHSYYSSILHSISFYLQEIQEKILDPAKAMLVAEIDAAQKYLDMIDMYEDHISLTDEVTSEDMARMAEILSWGLEIPPGWQSIQNSSSKLSNDLRKKLGSLRALVTTYND